MDWSSRWRIPENRGGPSRYSGSKQPGCPGAHRSIVSVSATVENAIPASSGRLDAESVSVKVQSPSMQRIEDLLAEGLATLDRGDESLAYHMFATATDQKQSKEAPAEYAELMKRAWFWRAKTAETLDDVVYSLEQGLLLDPGNLQLQAHMAWARQRLDREHKLLTQSMVSSGGATAAGDAATDSASPRKSRLAGGCQ